MVRRILTATLLLSILFFCFRLGDYYIFSLLLLITLLASYELGKLLFYKKSHTIISMLLNAILLVVSLKFEFIWTLTATYSLLVIAWIFFYIEIKSKTMNKSVLLGYVKSIILISFSFPYVLLLLNKPQGLLLLLILCIIIWSCDTFCLLIGKQIGSSHLSVASPNKTIEGSVGGSIGSILCTWLFLWTQGLFYWPSIILPIIMSTVSQIGDLYESLLKRRAHVKDASKLLPGHGGILDRSDSFLIGLPFYYILLTLLGL
jgi:phosphatidate cytidylyltransferase